MSAETAAKLNAIMGGWARAMRLELVSASADEVVADLVVGPEHLQAYGIVHGGVYSGVIETVVSVGAALHALTSGRSVVGLENHTSFLHAVREGSLRAVARPLSRGSRSQVWEATITTGEGQIAATGRVRLLCLEPGSAVAGQTIRRP
jgi:uncharacterized protein (TIGR00369 family)